MRYRLIVGDADVVLRGVLGFQACVADECVIEVVEGGQTHTLLEKSTQRQIDLVRWLIRREYRWREFQCLGIRTRFQRVVSHKSAQNARV